MENTIEPDTLVINEFKKEYTLIFNEFKPLLRMLRIVFWKVVSFRPDEPTLIEVDEFTECIDYNGNYLE